MTRQYITNWIQPAYVSGESFFSDSQQRMVTPLHLLLEHPDGTIEWVDFWWYTDELELSDALNEHQPQQMSLFEEINNG